MHKRFLGMLLVNLATFVWATNVVLGRWLRVAIGPITLAASRFTIATLIFVLLLSRRPRSERSPKGDAPMLLAMALTGVVVFAPLLYLGLRYTTAVNTTLINGLGPLITGILAGVLIGEPMTRRQVGGAMLGLFGVIWLISGGNPRLWLEMRFNVGDLIVLAAVTLWGGYSILGRKVMRHRSALSATAFSAFFGLPFLLPAALVETRFLPVHWSPGLMTSILYIGVAPTVIGFLSWNEGVRRLGPSGAMVFYNMLPVYGALLGFLLLGERVGPAHIVGGALIITGGLLGAGGSRSVAGKGEGNEH